MRQHDRQPEGKVSATEADWRRERAVQWWDPGRRLLGAIRGWQRWSGRVPPLGWAMARVCVARHRFWSAVSGAEIDLACQIGGGLRIPHPNGIVIHPRVRIGPNCLICQQVTIGTVKESPDVPCIGGHVDIGAGAKVLGGVTIGDHAKIGANAVVLVDVPAGATAVGVPARILVAVAADR
jgi:serine O-acetyltransferase